MWKAAASWSGKPAKAKFLPTEAPHTATADLKNVYNSRCSQCQTGHWTVPRPILGMLKHHTASLPTSTFDTLSHLAWVLYMGCPLTRYRGTRDTCEAACNGDVDRACQRRKAAALLKAARPEEGMQSKLQALQGIADEMTMCHSGKLRQTRTGCHTCITLEQKSERKEGVLGGTPGTAAPVRAKRVRAGLALQTWRSACPQTCRPRSAAHAPRCI